MFLPALCFILLNSLSATQRPLIDFDLIIDTLKTQGQWEALPGAAERYAFRPNNPPANWAPLREGRWLYTDYGWTWQGSNTGSWATEHLGHWTKTSSSGWLWVPDSQWLPGPVEWVKSGTHIGWRPSRLDRFSNPTESDAERYSDPSQWNFIPAEKLKDPLQLSDYADLATAEKLLKNREPADHVFTSYRQIERPGPSPDLLKTSSGDAPPIPTLREQQSPTLSPPEPTGAAATKNDYFAFRPKFHQDNDGIMRRIHLYLNPRAQQEQDQSLKETLGDRRTEEEKTKQQRKIEQQLEDERQKMEKLYR
jgi:hypothetical protein